MLAGEGVMRELGEFEDACEGSTDTRSISV